MPGTDKGRRRLQSVSPISDSQAKRQKLKTDRLDAENLADSVLETLLKYGYLMSPESIRNLVRLREDARIAKAFTDAGTRTSFGLCIPRGR